MLGLTFIRNCRNFACLTGAHIQLLNNRGKYTLRIKRVTGTHLSFNVMCAGSPKTIGDLSYFTRPMIRFMTGYTELARWDCTNLQPQQGALPVGPDSLE